MLSASERTGVYLSQTGSRALTGRQARRLAKKIRQAHAREQRAAIEAALRGAGRQWRGEQPDEQPDEAS